MELKDHEYRQLLDRLKYWEETATKNSESAEYYQKQLAAAHELLGRVVHQTSERWDSVNLTKYYPTDNRHHRRSVSNPSGRVKGNPGPELEYSNKEN